MRELFKKIIKNKCFKGYMKKVLLLLMIFGSTSALTFECSTPFYLTDFGIPKLKNKRDKKILKSYLSLLKREIIKKGYQIKPYSLYDWDGITFSVILTGYKRAPIANCRFTARLEEYEYFGGFGGIGPLLKNTLSIKSSGKIVRVNKNRTPNCKKAWKKLIEQVPYCK